VRSIRREYDFVITHHARERFVERFSRESYRFAHLSRRCNGCDKCRDLTFLLHEVVESRKALWDSIICAKLHDSEDVKCFYNNSIFMEYMYNKYGFHRFLFLVESNILFVVREAGNSEGEKVVITCMNANNPINGTTTITDFIKRPKYRKKEYQLQ
jgi:hypothetical protein